MSMSNKGHSAHSCNPEYLRRLQNIRAQNLELEEGEREAIRRKFPLFVPDDDEPNGLVLPGGIGPGDRLRIATRGSNVRIVRGPKS